ncbi:MAG: hypothetical protein JW762_04445 [Dehalococcoidales bacterium]|nr:hypothetical protein [Dehalococcoidales bacterium]
MKRFLILILAILVLMSGATIGCGTTPREQSESELEAYFAEELPITERRAETVTIVNKAIEEINLEFQKPVPDDPSKTQSETNETDPEKPPSLGLKRMTIDALLNAEPYTPKPTEPVIPSDLKTALISGTETLEWALERVDAEILDYKQLNPPPEAITYRGLIIEVLLKQRKAYEELLTYYNSFLQDGKGDIKALARADEYREESQRFLSLAIHELSQLLEEVTE